jgi:hypothetical protein
VRKSRCLENPTNGEPSCDKRDLTLHQVASP